LYGWRFRSLCRMCRTLLSDVSNDLRVLTRTPADRCQYSGSVLGCANWGRPISWLVTRDRTFFTPLPYPWTDCIWRWGFMSIHFMAKSAPSLHSGPHPQHTPVLKLHNAPCRKVTALAGTLVRHGTPTEKRVTKILKCFTFSSGPYIRKVLC